MDLQPDSKRAKLIKAKRLEKKMVKLQKGTDQIEKKYGQETEVAKGLFSQEGNHSRSTSCVPSRLYTREDNTIQILQPSDNRTGLSSTCQDSVICAPAFSRIEEDSFVHCQRSSPIQVEQSQLLDISPIKRSRDELEPEDQNFDYEIVDIKHYFHNGKKKRRVKKKKKRTNLQGSQTGYSQSVACDQSQSEYLREQSSMFMDSSRRVEIPPTPNPHELGPKIPIKSKVTDYQGPANNNENETRQSRSRAPQQHVNRPQRSCSVMDQMRPQINIMGQLNVPQQEQQPDQKQNANKPTLRQLKEQITKDKHIDISANGQSAQGQNTLAQCKQVQNSPGAIEAKKVEGQNFPLHRLLYQKDFGTMVSMFKQGVFHDQNINDKDMHGNTPILLAGKLTHGDDEYLKAVNYLFEKGANGKTRDANGWSLMDEAISQQNTRLLAIVFDHLNQRKKLRWLKNKQSIIKKLKAIPDFYLELHWECSSNWIPFLSRIAPNDTYQIWKVGSYLRLDFSLVGFSKLHQKRRRMSILFRDTQETGDKYKDIDIMLVNRDRQIVVNPLEDLDMDEKLAVLTDIINADPTQNELNIVDQEWKECRNFMGSQVKEVINDYECNKYKVIVKAQMQTRKKLKYSLKQSYEDYFSGQAEPSTEQQQVSRVSKDVKKNVESSLWLSQKFPLKINSFLTVLKTLSISGNSSMQKINDFMKNETLKDVINANGFPVKIQIPVALSIKATVTFNKFRYLENTPETIKETFYIPSDCNYICRKDGMKTLQNKKKRLAFANLAT